MKKRGIFSLLLLLITTVLYATTDLGTADELLVIDTKFSEAQTNTSSTVSIITSEEIEALHAQTTAELVGKAIGTTFQSYGSLGSMQTVVIRGATASKNLVFLDGKLLSSAHDGSVDLSIIPIDIIDHIEIIKSGTGNLGKTNAIGGMINIVTKKPKKTETPFTLTMENGSFLPLAYGSSDTQNWASLVDSQKLDLSYTNENIVATAGGLLAQNAYTYDDGTSTLALRDNAQVYEAHGSLKAKQDITDTLSYTTNNLVNYQDVGVPGGLSYGLTPDDEQKTLLVSTDNTFELEGGIDHIQKLTGNLQYSYNQVFYHDDDYVDSTHNKHKLSSQLAAVWDTDETWTLQTNAEYSLDYVDSTDVGQHTRHTISTSAFGSVYFADGLVSLYPSINLAYLSDIAALSPNASLGAIFDMTDHLNLSTTVSYAENAPTFSELYWPYMSNENLKTEKGINADTGITYENTNFSYEGKVFSKLISNAIAYDSTTWIPYNVAKSAYFGTEQTIKATLSSFTSVQISYQYNKSFDLSDGQTFSDNVEVTSVRKHTAKASLNYKKDRLSLVAGIQYLGSTDSLDDALIVDVSTDVKITDALSCYLAIDNLLNTSYELASGYPMPGTKIRIGGTLRF